MRREEIILKNSIGKRLFKLVIIISLFLTFLFTFIQAWMDYDNKTEKISQSIEQIKRIQLEMINTALWSADKEQLRAQVEGMRNFPYINYAAIVYHDNIVIDAGVKKEGGIHKEIILTYDYNGKNIALGRLIIQADTSEIISEVFRKIMIMFFFQAGTIFIAAFMVFMLFDRLVTRHLVAVAAQLTSYDIDKVKTPFHLRKKNHFDEIDILLEAFNNMIEKLSKSYREQQGTLRELHLTDL